MKYLGIFENHYDIWVEATDAKNREEAFEILDRNDTSPIVLTPKEFSKIVDEGCKLLNVRLVYCRLWNEQWETMIDFLIRTADSVARLERVLHDEIEEEFSQINFEDIDEAEKWLAKKLKEKKLNAEVIPFEVIPSSFENPSQ